MTARPAKRKEKSRASVTAGCYWMTNAHPYRKAIELPTPLRVAELFAGVGGFRLGLEGVRVHGSKAFEVLWGNQWEPSTNVQHAFGVYSKFEGGVHSNEDISLVRFAAEDARSAGTVVPDVDVLVGGFPCQDYSVARTLNQADGLTGKKGVLWWQIHRFLVDKGEAKPAVLILENVDRLLKSPADQRGRDFAVLLASLDNLGYLVEWRVVNAADYGLPQRRRRVFIVAYHNTLKLPILKNPRAWIVKDGVLAKALPVTSDVMTIDGNPVGHADLALISETFNKNGTAPRRFCNSGVFAGGQYWTCDTEPTYKGKRKVLRDVLTKKESEVPPEFYIPAEKLEAWAYLKGPKKEERVDKKTGFKYQYTEGPIAFPDPLDRPSRTIITGEGGAAPSRFKHVVCVNGRFRRLMPVELEALNGFPPGHTATTSEGVAVSDGKRAFLMGNALVVGIVKRIGAALARRLLKKKKSSRAVPVKKRVATTAKRPRLLVPA